MSDNTFKLDVKRLDELTPRALHDLLKLRVDVFVVEQKCPYPEIDGKDLDALHLRLLSGEDLCAAVRILPPKSQDAHTKIGRVVVSPAWRGKGLGYRIMREAMTVCAEHIPKNPVSLSAQSHLKDFYGSFGFRTTSEEYIEDGIPHVDMTLSSKAEI